MRNTAVWCINRDDEWMGYKKATSDWGWLFCVLLFVCDRSHHKLFSDDKIVVLLASLCKDILAVEKEGSVDFHLRVAHFLLVD